MANKIIKLQKLLRPLNAHSSILACSTYASAVLLQNQKMRLQQQNQLSNNITTSSTSNGTSSIDEFRAREEQREREFARAQEAAESARKPNEDEAKSAKLDVIRTKILEAALEHVPTHGWTRKSLVQGAEDVGMCGVVHGMFPEGGYAIVTHFHSKCNDELVQRLRTETNNGQKEVANPSEFLVRAVRERLEMITPYKSQWPQAQALAALPGNSATALAQLLTLVDDICYYSGDRSVDIGWYTRRIGLATIMKMTELYMITDSSPQHAKTWEFLQHRMDEAVNVESLLSQSDNVTHNVQRSFSSAFITARNILGLNYDRN